MRETTDAKDLSSYLEQEKQNGLFSSYFVEVGGLDRPESYFTSGERGLLFDLASLTKALASGPLIHDIFSKILDSSLFEHMPCEPFSDSVKALRLSALLNHRSGLPAWRNLWIGVLGLVPCEAFFKNPRIPLTFDRVKLRSNEDVYSDLNYLLLGYLIEHASDRRLDDAWSNFLQRLEVDPIDINFSTRLSQKPKEAFVPTGHCAVRQRELQGEVHDENCAALGGVAGHAGLFSSGPGLASYLKKLYASDIGRRYFEANERARLSHGFEGLSGLRRGSGRSAELFAKGESMGHLGFTGTAFWIHWPTIHYAIFLTNRVISGRVNPRMTEVRREVFGRLDALIP